jgi:hypothetical protein
MSATADNLVHPMCVSVRHRPRPYISYAKKNAGVLLAETLNVYPISYGVTCARRGTLMGYSRVNSYRYGGLGRVGHLQDLLAPVRRVGAASNRRNALRRLMIFQKSLVRKNLTIFLAQSKFLYRNFHVRLRRKIFKLVVFLPSC